MPVHAGKGTVFQVSVNSSFIPVGQVTSIGGPDASVGTFEVTNLDSSMREFTPTIGDGGSASLNVNYDPTNAGQAFLQGLVATPSTISCKIIFPTTTRFMTFGGVLTGFAAGPITVDNIHTRDIGIKISGSITVPTTT
jgi:hypothetical protein